MNKYSVIVKAYETHAQMQANKKPWDKRTTYTQNEFFEAVEEFSRTGKYISYYNKGKRLAEYHEAFNSFAGNNK